MREAVIVSAVRTPLGAFNGSLAPLGATQLGAREPRNWERLSFKRPSNGRASKKTPSTK